MSVGGLEIVLLINVFALGVLITLAIVHFLRHLHTPRRRQNTTAQSSVLTPEARQQLAARAERRFEQSLERSTERLEKQLAHTTEKLDDHIETLGEQIIAGEMARYKDSLETLQDTSQSAMSEANQSVVEHETDVRKKVATRQAELEKNLAELHAKFSEEMQARQSELHDMIVHEQQQYTARQAKLEAELEAHQVKLHQALDERESILAQRQSAIEAELIERQKRYNEKQAALNEQLERDMQLKRQVIAAQIDEHASEVVMSFITEALGQNVDLGAQADTLVALLEEHKQELIEGVSRGN